MLFSTVALTASLFAAGIQAKFSPSKEAIEADIVQRWEKRSPGYYGGGGDGSGSGQSTQREVQIVMVSDKTGKLEYIPDTVVAPVGSIVQFQFYPKNHTITESSFADPCVPLAANLTSETKPGQKSGFVPVEPDAQFRPVYNLLVNDTKPIWIYCGQKPHCAKGMAMVINQNMSDPTKTLQKYKEKAALLAPPASSSVASSAGSVVTPPPTSSAASATRPAGNTVSTTITSAVAPSVGTFSGAAYRPAATELAGFMGVALVGMAALL